MMWMWIAMMLLYLGGNAYIFLIFYQALHPAPTAVRILFVVLFWLTAISLFIYFALRGASIPQSISRMLFSIGSIWLVFTLYMVLSLALFDLLHLFIPSLHNGVWYSLIITSALLLYGYINYRTPLSEYITIDIEKPIEGEKYRMVAISDVHLGHGSTRDDLKRYVDMINSHNPDVVLIVGDLIDNSIEPVIKDRMLEEFDNIRAKDGIYMVAGNHEYISGINECIEHISSSRVHLLRDSVVKLSSGVQIIGRDDSFRLRRKPLDSLLMDADTALPMVVLDHQPKSISESKEHGVDIHISGHTHRGQVWPLNWITDAMYEQSHGYRRWEDTHVIVSSGLSLWGPPFRIGSRSELWVIDLK